MSRRTNPLGEVVRQLLDAAPRRSSGRGARRQRWLAPLALAPLALMLLVAPATTRAQRDISPPSTRPSAAAAALSVTVFTGQIVTLNRSMPTAEAVATRAGRVIAIGTRAHVDSIVPAGAAHVALEGVALPGFIDAHVHVAALGEWLESIDLRGLSKDSVLARVRRAASGSAAGTWIRGAGWDQSFWSPPDFPTARELDAASGSHPVVLDRIDGHALWVNSRALRLAGVSAASKDPAGGRIVRNGDGSPSGVFVDDAMDVVRRAMPAPTRADRTRQLRAAFAQYARWGLTSVHDAGISLVDLDAYHALANEGALPVRVYAMASASDAVLDKVLARPPELGSGGGTFTLRCIKIVDDGALGSRGARLSSPYADAPTSAGFSLVAPQRFDRIVKRAIDAGFQVAAHAIGDASTRDVLDAFARVGPTLREKRFRVEHASMIRDEDVARFAKLGVIASMQPVFVGEYSRFAEARVGATRLPWVLRSRDVIESGAAFAAGTDFPASDTGDPIATLASLVTRVGYDGKPASGWLPTQRVSVSVALSAMTAGAAFAAFEEGKGGIIAVGSYADFTVLSADPRTTPPNELHRLAVRRTVVGGRTTYSAPR